MQIRSLMPISKPHPWVRTNRMQLGNTKPYHLTDTLRKRDYEQDSGVPVCTLSLPRGVSI